MADVTNTGNAIGPIKPLVISSPLKPSSIKPTKPRKEKKK